MKSVEVTWLRVIKVWWCLVWRSALITVIAAFLAGFLIGIVGAFSGMSEELLGNVATGVGLAISLIVGVIIMRTLFEARWSDFRLALVRIDEEPREAAGLMAPDVIGGAAEASPAELPQSPGDRDR